MSKEKRKCEMSDSCFSYMATAVVPEVSLESLKLVQMMGLTMDDIEICCSGNVVLLVAAGKTSVLPPEQAFALSSCLLGAAREAEGSVAS